MTFCVKCDNRYVIGLPWKRDKSELPNNFALAEKYLKSLERGLLAELKEAEMYVKAMKEFIDN